MNCCSNEKARSFTGIFTALAIILAVLGILALAGCDHPRNSGGGSSGGGGHSHH